MRKYVIGNWKMNGNSYLMSETKSALTSVFASCPDINVVVCPPFTLLCECAGPDVPFKLGAQNVSKFYDGAYTGGISSRMLSDVGCQYAIVGHSECRVFYGDSSEDIACKIKNLIESKITPVFCVGETKIEHESNDPVEVVTGQISDVVSRLSQSQASKLIIAYEPVWAIGAGINGSMSEIHDVLSGVRTYLQRNSLKVPLLYGGSVTDNNILEIMTVTDVEGVLVGGASLKPLSFANICDSVQFYIDSAKRKKINF